MSEAKKPLPQLQQEPTEKSESNPQPPKPRGGQRSVIHYITILFAAAFALLLMTYVMERRQNEQVIDGLTQSVSGLRESLSTMQSAQQIYEENIALLEKVDQLEDRITSLEQDQIALQRELVQAQAAENRGSNQVQAMDWFWQIDQAYVRGRWNTARRLIQSLEEANLVPYLPHESATGEDSPSPSDRYQEIYDALF